MWDIPTGTDSMKFLFEILQFLPKKTKEIVL